MQVLTRILARIIFLIIYHTISHVHSERPICHVNVETKDTRQSSVFSLHSPPSKKTVTTMKLASRIENSNFSSITNIHETDFSGPSEHSDLDDEEYADLDLCLNSDIDSRARLSDIEYSSLCEEKRSSTESFVPVIFRLRGKLDFREVTMVASWSAWREHSVLFHRSRFNSDFVLDEERCWDQDSLVFIQVDVPTGTHYFKVNRFISFGLLMCSYHD